MEQGGRDNGIRADRYVAIADLDPRVADAVMSALRDEGIAAYAVPTTGATGGYLEARVPQMPTDRLWADETHAARARSLVSDERRAEPVAATPDLDTAWQQVLASLQSTPASPVPPWPVSEDVDAPTASVDTPVLQATDDVDEHFVPPPPPPLPRLHQATLLSILAIVGGAFVLFTGFDGGDLNILAAIAIVGGVVNLIWRMRPGPPTDSGWDDGAVL